MCWACAKCFLHVNNMLWCNKYSCTRRFSWIINSIILRNRAGKSDIMGFWCQTKCSAIVSLAPFWIADDTRRTFWNLHLWPNIVDYVKFGTSKGYSLFIIHDYIMGSRKCDHLNRILSVWPTHKEFHLWSSWHRNDSNSYYLDIHADADLWQCHFLGKSRMGLIWHIGSFS